jgi:hypothetical protein
MGRARPVVHLDADLFRAVDDASAALSSCHDLFHRDGQLVQVLRGDATARIVRDAPHVRPLGVPTLREVLTRVAIFARFDARARRELRVIPTDALVAAVLHRGSWPNLPDLVGIVEAPALRPDGSIVQQPGYDVATGYLYLPALRFPPIQDRPTKDDASRAREALEDVFADFPFRGPENRSAALAGLLTLLARPAIRGSTPAILTDANVRGSGKTLVVDTISIIATGRPTPKMNYPPDDVELEKVLGSYAIRGASTINFDNITRPFGGGPLDRCLTAVNSVELRVLGKSEIPSLPWRAVIFGTGNNLVLTGDTARRVIVCRLESPLEHPENRSGFRHPNLLEWVAENRARLVCAALTILRAWIVAGRPRCGCEPWGSFEAWSALVPPALVFAGAADPMLARSERVGVEDEEKAALEAILTGWARLDADGTGLTAKVALDALYPRVRDIGPPDGFSDLREAIEMLVPTKHGMAPEARRVGIALRRLKGRIIGGRKLVADEARGGVARWRVVLTEGAPMPPPVQAAPDPLPFLCPLPTQAPGGHDAR